MEHSNSLSKVGSLLILSTLAFAAVAEARLGETPVEFIDRYGLHKKSTMPPGVVAPLLKNAVVRHYEKGGWRVTAAFLDIASPAIRIELQKTNGTPLTVDEITAILAANSGGKAWKRAVYRNPSTPNEPAQLVGEAIIAPAFGMASWERSDGATATLQFRQTLRLELPAAKRHEEANKRKVEEKEISSRPNF